MTEPAATGYLDVMPTRVFVVVMGVSGSGKTTLAERSPSPRTGEFLEGDDLHPPANVEKMARGEPLTDDDRRPWLEAIGRWIDARAARRRAARCSPAPRSGVPIATGCAPGGPSVRFCHLRRRRRPRSSSGSRTARGHFMPASLLPSQLATLEPLARTSPASRCRRRRRRRASLAEVARRPSASLA